MILFSDFKHDQTAASFVQRLFGVDLATVSSWQDLRSTVLANRSSFRSPGDTDPNAAFVEQIEDQFGMASTGEKTLIMGLLYAVDYGGMADKLAAKHNRSFQDLLESTDKNFRTRTAACIARLD